LKLYAKGHGRDFTGLVHISNKSSYY
jgi:hypothetical protein